MDEEPEAAYLRNIVRRVLAIESSDATPHGALEQIRMVCAEALRRPHTNGEVIDKLQRKLAALEERPIDLHAYKVRAEVAEQRADFAEAEAEKLKASGTRYEPAKIEAVVDAAAASLQPMHEGLLAPVRAAVLTAARQLAQELPVDERNQRGVEQLAYIEAVLGAKDGW